MKRLLLTLAAASMLVGCGQTKKTEAQEAPESIETQKMVALSFDDGPNTTITVHMLDMLQKHGVKGSFYVIGQNINDESAAIMKRAYEMGCDIQNHSFSHGDMTKLSEEELKVEIQKTTDLIVKYIGVEPNYFRPPYISHNQTMHETIDLTFISGAGIEDWVPSIDAQERAKRILDLAKDGLIYLLHDMPGNEATVEALDIAIPQLKEQGYQFVTVPELFKAKNITPEKGTIYTYLLKE